MKRYPLALRIILAAGLLGPVSACGIKGPLERPAPLWGNPNIEAAKRSTTRDEDVPGNSVILTNEVFAEERDDASPRLLGGPVDGSE
jgi:predicted small lipoprotein YifL